MIYLDSRKEVYENLRADCEKCFGLCCVSLYFSKSEGFPNDKVAGTPCINLQSDFRCSIHENLRKKVLKDVVHMSVLEQVKKYLKLHTMDVIGEKKQNLKIKCLMFF